MSWLTVALLLLGVTASIAEGHSFLGKLYPAPDSLPQPKAFFPLTDGIGNSVSTWPDTDYNGTFNALIANDDWWVADDVFGTVMYCSKNASDYVTLSPVDYAGTGSFSIAFWLKPNIQELTGSLFQYLYSHSAYGIGTSVDAYAPNSINIFLPANQHTAFGLVRTVVKDDNDGDALNYMDSDGTYNNNNVRFANNATKVVDGQWHFVTLTSRPEGGNGYLVYIDGSLAAQLPPPVYQEGYTAVEVDGGDPIQLTADIVLCSRDNLTADRFFSGSLAHLSLFDTALTSEQVSNLYKAVPLASLAPPSAGNPVSFGLGSSDWLNQFSTSPYLQAVGGSVAMCLTNSTDGYCNSGYFCVPLSPAHLSNLGGVYESLPIGVCALPNGIRLPTNSIPVPAAYFPLSNWTGTSWPLPDQWFWNTSADTPVPWTADDTFGTVIDCNATSQSTLSASLQRWGESGAFAFNFWIQQRSSEGGFYQFLLSTRSSEDGPVSDVAVDLYQPNQVHIYLPESDQPSHGLVRSILKDSTDKYSSSADANFLDSDGLIGVNLARNTSRLNLTDGLWHMITLTTLSTGDKGYTLYVDGLLTAIEQEPQQFFAVSGGDPIFVNGTMVLCGRQDLAAERFFDGKLAQLSIFDTALTSQTVSTLYSQVYQSSPPQSVQASYARTTPVTISQPPAADLNLIPSPVFSYPDDTVTAGIGLQQAPDLGSDSSQLAGQDPAEASGADSSSSGSTSSLAQLAGNNSPPASHGLSNGAIAGVVIGALAGITALVALAAVLVTRTRGRRLNGVARLQEVPMPELSTRAPEDRYIEDQYVVTLNHKVHEAEQRKVADT